jgi:DNA-binding MarR family transcriptional regulator
MNAKASRPVPASGVTEFYKPKGYAPEQSAGYLMRRILTAMAQEVDRRLEPMGLTNAQWVPLIKLYMGHGATVAELARVTQMDAGAMTRLLDRLEAKGLIRRQRNAQDRRVVNLELTDAGREAAHDIPQVLCEVQNACLAGFSHDEWQTLKSLLARVVDNASAFQSPGDPS